MSATYEGIPIRRLPLGEMKNRQYVGVGWRHKLLPLPTNRVALRLWWSITDPEIIDELHRLRLYRSGRTWTGPKTVETMEFCRILKPTGIVRRISTHHVKEKEKAKGKVLICPRTK